MLQRIKKNYHWIIAVLVFLEMVVYGGMINSASVFIQPISQDLGVKTTAYAVAMMPYTVTCFLGTCVSGYLFTRFGYKRTALVSLAVVAFSLVLTGLSKNLTVFCVSKILFGLGYGACFTAGSVRIIKDWFQKHQGLVLGAVSMATGIGGSLMTMLLSGVIQKSNWRTANFVAAGLVAVIFVLYLLIKDRPEQIKLRPFGFGTPMKAQKVKNTHQDWPGFPLKQQLKRPMFYLMCLCVVLSCVCLYTTSGFVIPHFRSQGYSAQMAAFYQSAYMLFLAVVKLAVGFMYDRLGAKPVMIMCMLCGAVSQAMLSMTADPVVSFIAMLLFSAGLCMSSIMIPLIATPLFGHKTCLSINGIFLGLSSLSNMFSTAIGSMCYDTYGVYTPVYRVTSVMLIGVLALYLSLFALSKKERARYYEMNPNK